MRGQLKDRVRVPRIGQSRNRDDAILAVTGRKKFSMDLQVPGALPTMVCRAPTLNGTPKRLRNKAEILAMPGVEDVAMVDTGVAVRAETFGQCIDAIRAMDVEWAPGSVEGESDQTSWPSSSAPSCRWRCRRCRSWPTSSTCDFEFFFRCNAALDTNCAVADVRADSAEIWSGLKTPIPAQENIAQALGLSPDQVKVHVMQGGGSFGRRLFFDAALEAAKISQAMGKPVQLMWHRADEPRLGRLHPMVTITDPRDVRSPARCWPSSRATPASRPTSATGSARSSPSTADELPTGLGNLGFSETHLRADAGAALRLRRDHPAAQRDRRPVQHREHAQHLLARRPGRRPSSSSTSSRRSRAWTPSSSG